ncbi:MAG: hypothetical protein R2716_10800 [Microthrixaceae bacterium]
MAALLVGRRLWFFSDDWNIFAGYHAGSLLEPFNRHLSLLPAGTYQLLFRTVGVDSYLPFRLAGMAALGVLGFQVARHSTARSGWLVGLVVTAAVMWNGAGETNVLFPFLMNFSLPLAALSSRAGGTSGACEAGPDTGSSGHSTGGDLRHLVALGVWVAVALASSGLGVVVAGQSLELVLRVASRCGCGSPGPCRWERGRSGGWDTGARRRSFDPPSWSPARPTHAPGRCELGRCGVRSTGAVLLVGLAAALAVGLARSREHAPRVVAVVAATGAFCLLTAMAAPGHRRASTARRVALRLDRRRPADAEACSRSACRFCGPPACRRFTTAGRRGSASSRGQRREAPPLRWSWSWSSWPSTRGRSCWACRTGAARSPTLRQGCEPTSTRWRPSGRGIFPAGRCPRTLSLRARCGRGVPRRGR